MPYASSMPAIYSCSTGQLEPSLNTESAATATNPSFIQSAANDGHIPAKTLWSGLQEVCALLDIPVIQLASDADHAFQHIHLRSGQRIYAAGQTFEHFYLINSGFAKTALLDESGGEHVIGFPMRGDLLGFDGLHSGHYPSQAVALSHCDIILIPFNRVCALGRISPEFEVAIYGAMSRELVREQAMAGMLISLRAEARIGHFLIALSERYAAMGYSGKQFNLRVTRQEIGSYLGLALESVSRTLSELHCLGLIAVDKRAITILDYEMLSILQRSPPAGARRVRRDKSPITAPPPSANMDKVINS
jgi:CRP/FNR family transcriptional regulator, anaerobic regulatory protein